MTTVPPSPFIISACPLTADTAPAAESRNPDAAGAIEFQSSCGGIFTDDLTGCQAKAVPDQAADVGAAPDPQETNHIHEIFHFARRLYEDDHRFVLDEKAFYEAIEPPPLFMQRATG